MAILFHANAAVEIGQPAVQVLTAGMFEAAYSSEGWGVRVDPNAAGHMWGFDNVADVANLWFHIAVRFNPAAPNLFHGNSDGHWMSVYNTAGQMIAQIDVLNGTYAAKVYGDTTVTGAFATFTTAALYHFDVQITTGANITMNFYSNGALVSTATAANTSGSKGGAKVIQFEHDDITASLYSNALVYSQFIVTDNEDTRGWRLAELKPLAAGAATAWAGTVADVADDDPATSHLLGHGGAT